MSRDLLQWAARWGVPTEALADLVATLMPSTAGVAAGDENAVSMTVRAAATHAGGRLWRNNVGALRADDGRLVRYGLCNDSKAMNERTKSSDLIGPMPRVVTQDMVGTLVGVFTAREVKRPGWRYTGTTREQAQLNFLTLVASLGGDAKFTTGEL